MNPYEPPPILAELNEPKSAKPQMLPGFPAGACAFFITAILVFVASLSMCIQRNGGDRNEFTVGGAVISAALAFLFSLPLIRWAVLGR